VSHPEGESSPKDQICAGPVQPGGSGHQERQERNGIRIYPGCFMKKKMGRLSGRQLNRQTAKKDIVRENLFLDFLNCSCHKKTIIVRQILYFHNVFIFNFREIINRKIFFLRSCEY